jgi:hypothetical protein
VVGNVYIHPLLVDLKCITEGLAKHLVDAPCLGISPALGEDEAHCSLRSAIVSGVDGLGEA